ncbi:hypothetical protein NL108_006557, partial [Boleophthalmus pectinirostris]
ICTVYLCSAMDAAGYRSEGHFGEAETVWHVMHRSEDVEVRGRDGEGFRLVEAFLTGGAPWGFTLRGGLEHREPLVITKVEEGSKAAAVGLQVADELVNINEIPLSGYRQEAICLVKGSHKTLSLVVKRKMKMVDFVAQKMPSENDVHVARSFLTKILRSSMSSVFCLFCRRNEPISRPHSWHSTKFNEHQSEPAKTQSPPSQVWHTRYDASSSSADLTSSWEQTNLRRVSDQFSSLGSMDSLEHVPHPYPASPLTPAKSNNSMEHVGGGGRRRRRRRRGKRDSAYSSFSTSSGTPDYTLSKSNAASTENVLYKVNQWDTGGKHVSNRNPQSEGARQEDRVTYFQMPGCDSQHSEDQAGSRVSTSSRSSFGPVWHVPEKNKKTSSPSPPPPAPPTRSDSFAATKQHDRGHSMGHFEGPQETHSKMAMDHRRSYNLSPKNDFDNLSQNVHSQFSANKQHSSNVQQGHHGDKSTFFPQPWTSSAGKPFSNTQEIQSNGSTHSQSHRRNLSTSSSTTVSEQSSENSNRYYCVTPTQSMHPNVQQPFVAEDRRISTSSERSVCLSPQNVMKMRYSLPMPQHTTQAKVMEERGIPPPNVETPYMSYPANRTSEQRRSMPVQPTAAQQDIKQQVNNKICPKATPILHSLSMDASANLDEQGEGKNIQRNERFATTLRNEIQMRRAKLQKSKSAATLPANETETEDRDVWKSSENATPTSNAYKDNLKEMQARVLKATSFRRRDLEPVLVEHPVSELSTNYTSVVRKEMNSSLPPVSESVRSKSGPVNVQVTRIGGRKRFSAEKKVRSFSEPDKIHHVGMKEDQNIDSSLDTESGSTYVHGTARNHKDVRPQSFAASIETAPPPSHYPEDTQGGTVNIQHVSEHQRLGTFAEYEERWSIQKKPAAEKRVSGRYRSADNILDQETEERSSTCYHERSRSSPSADLFTQKFPVPARKSESEYSQTEDCKPAQQLSAATGFVSAFRLADRLREQEPFTAPPTQPRTASSRGGPTVSSHKPIAFSHNLQDPRKEDARSEPRSNPPSACQDVTSSNTSDISSHPSPAPPPAPIPKTGLEQAKGLVDKGQGAEQQPVTASSHSETGQNNMETQRPPSPQFSPQKLSDKPPVSLHEDSNSNRFEQVVEAQNPAVKKVPIRIVHSEGAAEKENCPFLKHPDPTPAEGQTVVRLASLNAGGQDSVFCAFTRSKEQDNVTQNQPQKDTYISTIKDHNMNSDEQANNNNKPADSTTEDQKRAELARDIMGKDKSLAEILDQSRMKTTMDMMEGIFPEGEQLIEGAHHRRKGSVKQAPPRPQENREKEDNMPAVTMVTSATYYSTSAPKAELLIKMKDMPEEEVDSEEELDLDLANKKQELIDSLTKKLQVLREARESLQEDILDNNALGEEVEVQVQQVCKPNELDKFRMFVGDLDKVVSLLLSLSGRLARVENALNSLEEDATPEER